MTDPAALAALARASDDPDLRFAALEALAASGDAGGAASFLSLPLPEAAHGRLLERLFADPLLAEAALARYAGPDAFLGTAARLARGEIDPAAVVARPDRASPHLLPLAARLAAASGRPADLPALERLGRAEEPGAAQAKLALALLLAGSGERDRALRLAYAHPHPAAAPLTLLVCRAATGEAGYLALARREAAGIRTFSSAAIEAVGRLLLDRAADPSAEGLLSLVATLKLGGDLPAALEAALAAIRDERLLDRADRLTALGCDGAAGASLKRLLSGAGKNLDGLLKLSEVQERAGRPEGALALLEAIERERPAEPEIDRRIVENLLRLDRKEAALDRLLAMARRDPSDRSALETALSLTVDLKGETAARPLAARLLALDPASVPALRALARSAGPEEAEEAWLALVKAAPRDEEALAALRAIRQSETTRAAGELEKKALEFAAKGDFGRAERDLRELLDLTPSHIQGYRSLAAVLERQGKLADAFHALRRGTAADPDVRVPELWRAAGELAFRLRDLAECRDLLDTYRDARPKDLAGRLRLLEAKRELAYRAGESGDLTGELAALDEELAERPDDPALLLEKGFTLEFFPRFLRAPDHESGLPLLSAATTGFPERAEVATVHVTALLRAGRADEALRALAAAEARGLAMGAAVRAVAEHFLESGDTERGLEWGRRLLAEAPDDPLAVDVARLEAAEVAKGGLVKASDHLKMLRKRAETPAELFRLGYGFLALPDAARLLGDPYSTALDLFKQALALSDTHPGALAGLRDLALKAGHEMPELLAEADKNLRRAVERAPDSGFLLATLAELADAGFGKERKKEAVNLYDAALKRDFFQPRVHQLLAGCLRLLKDNTRAAFHFTVVVDLARGKAMKDEAIRALNYLKRNAPL